MKRSLLFSILTAGILALIPFTVKAQDNVGIGTTTPDASAILEMMSTNKGLLIPRMTAVQRLALTPANSLM
ncbi:MAG: hypothetical protein IT233_11410, partial [Bacteroidia bacterium]|nr:hypothetical protein [Bacteroidia bacterium]